MEWLLSEFDTRIEMVKGPNIFTWADLWGKVLKYLNWTYPLHKAII